MKIIHFFRSPVGGIFRHVRDLVAQQHADGHKVGIICDSLTGGVYEENEFRKLSPKLNLGLHKFPIPRSISPRDLTALVQSRKLISEIQPDVVHSHSAKGGIHGRLSAKMAASKNHEIKTFYCPHGGAMHYDASSLKGRIFFAAERFMERYTDSLIFVSDYERKAYYDKVGTPICPDAIVFNGLANEEFEPVRADGDAAEFLYIGMMRDLKGPDLFIDALHLIRTQFGRDVRGMFVGDGPDKENYISKIKTLGLKDVISIHAAMPAREAFKGGKIVVVPSRAESMPYLVLEAVAAHKPLVATNVGGIPEIFGERSDDLVQPGDYKHLASKMCDCLDNEQKDTDAVEFAASLKGRFSLPAMARSVQSLYES